MAQTRRMCALVTGRHPPRPRLASRQFPEWPDEGEARREIGDSEFVRRLETIKAALARLEISIPRDLSARVNSCVEGYLKLLDRVSALESQRRVVARRGL